MPLTRVFLQSDMPFGRPRPRTSVQKALLLRYVMFQVGGLLLRLLLEVIHFDRIKKGGGGLSWKTKSFHEGLISKVIPSSLCRYCHALSNFQEGSTKDEFFSRSGLTWTSNVAYFDSLPKTFRTKSDNMQTANCKLQTENLLYRQTLRTKPKLVFACIACDWLMARVSWCRV